VGPKNSKKAPKVSTYSIGGPIMLIKVALLGKILYFLISVGPQTLSTDPLEVKNLTRVLFVSGFSFQKAFLKNISFNF
jgi:hypothetical protein